MNERDVLKIKTRKDAEDFLRYVGLSLGLIPNEMPEAKWLEMMMSGWDSFKKRH